MLTKIPFFSTKSNTFVQYNFDLDSNDWSRFHHILFKSPAVLWPNVEISLLPEGSVTVSAPSDSFSEFYLEKSLFGISGEMTTNGILWNQKNFVKN